MFERPAIDWFDSILQKKNVCGGDSTKKLYAGDYGNVASTLKYCFYLFIYGLNHILLQFQSFDSVGRTIIWQDWFHFFFFYNFKLFSSIIARSNRLVVRFLTSSLQLELKQIKYYLCNDFVVVVVLYCCLLLYITLCYISSSSSSYYYYCYIVELLASIG